MATYLLAPDPCQSTFLIPGTNTPGNGVQVFTYAAGTTTKVTAAKDNAGAAFHTNPIILDSGGNLPSASSMWFEEGVSMKVVWAPSNDSDPPASPYRTIDNIAGVPAAEEAVASTAQWVDISTPTFVNGTTFRVTGDQTGEIHVGRRIRTNNTGGTVYSRVTSSAFATSTTVGLINDSGTLDSGLSSAAYGLLSAVNPSVPLLTHFYPIRRNSTNAAGILGFGLNGWTSTGAVNWQATTAATVAYIGDLAFGNLTTTNARLIFPPKHMAGLILANNGVDQVDISAGSTVNSSATHNLILAAALTKDPTTTWTASTGGGGLLDAGAVSTNIWYWAHAIKNVSTVSGTTSQWVDVGFSSSFSAPSLPANYTVQGYSPLGAIRREASSTKLFTMVEMGGGGIHYLATNPALDVNAAIASTVSSTFTLANVPSGPKVMAFLNVTLTVGSSGESTAAYVHSLDASDSAFTFTAAPLPNIGDAFMAHNSTAGYLTVRTNTSSQIAARALNNGVDIRMAVLGWEWGRR